MEVKWIRLTLYTNVEFPEDTDQWEHTLSEFIMETLRLLALKETIKTLSVLKQ